jgi:hypothetical protein
MIRSKAPKWPKVVQFSKIELFCTCILSFPPKLLHTELPKLVFLNFLFAQELVFLVSKCHAAAVRSPHLKWTVISSLQ